MNSWQPFKSHPRDGTEFLLRSRFQDSLWEYTIAYWKHGTLWTQQGEGEFTLIVDEEAHWHPIPS